MTNTDKYRRYCEPLLRAASTPVVHTHMTRVLFLLFDLLHFVHLTRRTRPVLFLSLLRRYRQPMMTLLMMIIRTATAAATTASARIRTTTTTATAAATAADVTLAALGPLQLLLFGEHRQRMRWPADALRRWHTARTATQPAAAHRTTGSARSAAKSRRTAAATVAARPERTARTAERCSATGSDHHAARSHSERSAGSARSAAQRRMRHPNRHRWHSATAAAVCGRQLLRAQLHQIWQISALLLLWSMCVRLMIRLRARIVCRIVGRLVCRPHLRQSRRSARPW